MPQSLIYDPVPDGLDRLRFIDVIAKHKTHKIINLIDNRISFTYEFTFKVIFPDIFGDYVNKLQNDKAIGHDGLKATFMELFGTQLCNSLCEIFNMCMKTSSFPSEIKFIKDDSIFKENYRSINLLTMVSKRFENIISD